MLYKNRPIKICHNSKNKKFEVRYKDTNEFISNIPIKVKVEVAKKDG